MAQDDLREPSVVKFWEPKILRLKYLTPFYWLSSIFPSIKTHVDRWVMGHLLISALCWLLMPYFPCPLVVFILCYAGLRVFEIVHYQLRVVLVDPRIAAEKGEEWTVLSLYRLIYLLLHNYVEVLFWYACYYRNLSDLFHSEGITLKASINSLYFSLATMSTLGYGDIRPAGQWGALIVSTQVLVGVFMALIIFARFMSLLPRPVARQDH